MTDVAGLLQAQEGVGPRQARYVRSSRPISMRQPPWILVVDDEPSLRALTADALSLEGYEVRTADNGQRALEMLPYWAPDIVVLDMMMPVLDGWAFIEKYRAVAAAEVAIIGVSAAMTASMADRLKELGVPVCLCKPFNLAELVSWVVRLVGSAS